MSLRYARKSRIIEEYKEIRAEAIKTIHSVFQKGKLVLGEPLYEFEESLADYIGAPFAVGVGSGSDAIYLGLIASGVGTGDEVITVGNVCVAVVESILRTGASVRFVDINSSTYHIDTRKLKQTINACTKAILVVHAYGLPAPMEDVKEIVNDSSVKVFEACGQAFGARYQGKIVGSIGDVGCLSFNPGKILGGIGDGGAVTTKHENIAQKVRKLRDHGRKRVGAEAEYLGISSRLGTVNAAVLNTKLQYVDEWIKLRQKKADLYQDFLRPDIKFQTQPVDREGMYQFLVVEVKNRKKVIHQLKTNGIDVKIHYSPPPYEMKAYKDCDLISGIESLEVTNRVLKRILTLPLHRYLSEAEIKLVAELLKKSTKSY